MYISQPQPCRTPNPDKVVDLWYGMAWLVVKYLSEVVMLVSRKHDMTLVECAPRIGGALPNTRALSRGSFLIRIEAFRRAVILCHRHTATRNLWINRQHFQLSEYISLQGLTTEERSMPWLE